MTKWGALPRTRLCPILLPETTSGGAVNIVSPIFQFVSPLSNPPDPEATDLATYVHAASHLLIPGGRMVVSRGECRGL
jgi:hypothetical protein